MPSDIQIPVCFLTMAGEHMRKRLVLSFNGAVALWMVCRRKVVLNAAFARELRYFVILEVCALACLDVHRTSNRGIKVSFRNLMTSFPVAALHGTASGQRVTT